MTVSAGIHDFAPNVYHADPCDSPSLSSSIAKIILEQSPRHGWFCHSRLNPAYQSENKQAYDVGSAAHTLLLGDGRGLAVIDAENYKTKAAQDARDKAYANGLIPLLTRQHIDVLAMATSARQQLDQHEASDAFTKGLPERTLVWKEGDVWCRAMLDWLPDDPKRAYDDFKSTSGSASPDHWQRNLFSMNYDIQAAFYRRGIRAVLGIHNPVFRFVIQETSAPYCLSVVALDPQAIDFANKKVVEAIHLWSACIERNEWPGYSNRIAYVSPPPYNEAAWLEREVRNEMSGDALQNLIKFQAPLGVE